MTAVNHELGTVSAAPRARERRAQHEQHFHRDLYTVTSLPASLGSNYRSSQGRSSTDDWRSLMISDAPGRSPCVVRKDKSATFPIQSRFCITRRFRCRFTSSLQALLFNLNSQKWRKLLPRCASPRSGAHLSLKTEVCVSSVSAHRCQQVAAAGLSNFYRCRPVTRAPPPLLRWRPGLWILMTHRDVSRQWTGAGRLANTEHSLVNGWFMHNK